MDQSSLPSGPILENQETNREHIPIHITETGDTKTSFRRKPKMKRIIGSMNSFKTESESETKASRAHSRYILNVLTRKVFHDPTFVGQQNDTLGYFQIVRTRFKYKDRHVIVDGKSYKASVDL